MLMLSLTHGELQNEVNIGSGNGVLPGGSKPLLVICEVLWQPSESNCIVNAQAATL